MKIHSPVVDELAARFERSRAGQKAGALRDISFPLEEILLAAGCSEGEKRAVAEQELGECANRGLVVLVPFHPRDPSRIRAVRVGVTKEADLYSYLGRQSPTQRRNAVASQFVTAATYDIPSRWQNRWRTWCDQMRIAAVNGDAIAPFEREATEANNRLLSLLPKLLAWESESLVRFVSCILCDDSKQLEALASRETEGPLSGQLRGKLGRLLESITEGQIQTLDDLGILPNPRSALVHGPLRLLLDGSVLDLNVLRGPFRLGAADILRAQAIETSSLRCLTVENETTFHELAKLRSGVLLICTSYPGSGTIALINRLPGDIECWHFGDSDDAGFEILRVLREQSGRDFRALHMVRGRLPFEQEALGRPKHIAWPFYDFCEPGKI